MNEAVSGKNPVDFALCKRSDDPFEDPTVGPDTGTEICTGSAILAGAGVYERYLLNVRGKVLLMTKRALRALLVTALISSAGMAAAGVVEDRVNDHVEAAVKDGLRPADFHHLFMILGWRATFADWTLAERSLDRLAGVRRIDPLMADELRLSRARLEVDRGRTAAARELFRTMGGLSGWWFHGPKPLEELADFEDLAVVPAPDFDWRPVPATDPLGWVRISGLAWPSQRQMAYLATTVVSDREQPVAVRIGAAQVARVWLNGAALLTTPQPLTRAEDQAAAAGWLRPGNNQLVIAVASEHDEWWLRARLTAPDGSGLTGVREALEEPSAQDAVNKKPPPVRELGAEIRRAVDDRVPGASTALAAFLVAHRPEPGDGGKARAACRAARNEAPGEARLLEWILTTEAGQARELLAQAVEADKDLLWARLELADWYGERGLYEEASELLAAGDQSEPVLQSARLDLDSELWGQVILPQLVQLGRAWPQCLRVNTSIAERAAGARRWELAEEAMVRLERLVPGVIEVLDLREHLAESCGDGQVLHGIFADLLEFDPNQPWVRVRLARLLRADQNLVGARDVLGEGLDRSPSNVDLMMELATIEHLGGNEDLAVALASEVLDIRPQDRRAQRMLELLGESSEDLGWMRTPGELRKLADEAAPSDPAVVVLDHRELRFLPSNLTEERVQKAILITAAERADDLLTFTVPFVAEKERLRMLAARIHRRDGAEVSASQGDTPRLSEPEFNLYYDTRLRVLRFSDFADGDLVEIAYILSETEEANETGPYNGGLIPLGQQIPIALAEIELTGPEELLPAWELAHLEGEPERVEDEVGGIHLRWRWQNLPAIVGDVPSAPMLLVTPYLVYSNHPEWGSLADWYGRHVAPRIRTSTQVRETAQRLVDGHEDRLDRIARIYRFVTNEIRYVGLEFGEHRFRPFSADWVLHHRIGDCKDKAALLVALYDAIGIPARMVMVRTADLGPVSNEMAFNHAIAYLPEDDLWLDGTASGHAPHPPPTMDQNAFVLVVDGPESRPQNLPVVGGGLERVDFTLRASDEGLVDVAIRAEDTGESANLRRVRFAGSREPRRFARWLQSQFPGAELIGEPKLQLVPGRDPTVVEIEGTVPRSALVSAGGIQTFPGRLEWSASMIPGGDRHGPLTTAVQPDLEWTLTVDLRRLPKELPAPVDFSTPFGSLRIKVQAEDLGYRVEGFLHLESGLFAAEEVAELRRFLVAVERHLSRRLEAP
jgi:tetratricopeptide (TPR) repeat protein